MNIKFGYSNVDFNNTESLLREINSLYSRLSESENTAFDIFYGKTEVGDGAWYEPSRWERRIPKIFSVFYNYWKWRERFDSLLKYFSFVNSTSYKFFTVTSDMITYVIKLEDEYRKLKAIKGIDNAYQIVEMQRVIDQLNKKLNEYEFPLKKLENT